MIPEGQRRSIRPGLRPVALVLLALCPTLLAAPAGKNVLLPRLHAGQTLQYDINGRVQRRVAAQSRVTTLLQQPSMLENISAMLTVQIVAVREENARPVFDATADFSLPPEPGSKERVAAGKPVHFTLQSNGDAVRVTGADELPPTLQLAWQFWIARFSLPWTLPAGGVKPGDSWKVELPETTPSAIDKLFWDRESTYGEDGPCPLAPSDLCAKFLTRSTLHQKSLPKDTTPDDYLEQQLKTSGTATGSNETYTVLSLSTGLLQRATESSRQSMDVTISRSDGSNSVHYTIGAESSLEVLVHPTAPSHAD